MSIVSIILWCYVGWLLLTALKDVRQAWQQNPENPTRIFLADFSGYAILVVIVSIIVPYKLIAVNSNGKEMMRVLTAIIGIGEINRGDFVQYEYNNNHSIFSRLIGFSKDELTVIDNAIHVNGVPLGQSVDAFLRFDTNCQTIVVPQGYFAVMDWGGSGTTRCRDIKLSPMKTLEAHCVGVVWPLSESCSVPTNRIPRAKEVAGSTEA